jgi:SAM-dependent methyltransferase
LDRAEFAWWEKFAEVEDKYCWVQTPAVQRIIRQDYVRQIARAVPSGANVLEIGCGTGWLSLLLAEAGAGTVHGVEFSAAQIRLAQEGAAAAKLSDKVRFHRIQSSLTELLSLLPGLKFDAMIIHGVIHHLTNAEIRTLMETFCQDLAAEAAQVFVMEPVRYPRPPQGGQQRLLDRLVDRLILLPMVGQRSGLRKRSAKEAEVLERISQRYTDPHSAGGPSPKEIPFSPGEVEALLQPYVTIRQKTPVLLFSYHVAKNLLLTELTYPGLMRAVMPAYLRLARGIERGMLARKQRPSALPVFELFECEIRPPAVDGG